MYFRERNHFLEILAHANGSEPMLSHKEAKKLKASFINHTVSTQTFIEETELFLPMVNLYSYIRKVMVCKTNNGRLEPSFGYIYIEHGKLDDGKMVIQFTKNYPYNEHTVGSINMIHDMEIESLVCTWKYNIVNKAFH